MDASGCRESRARSGKAQAAQIVPEDAPDALMDLARVIYDLFVEARRMGREMQERAITDAAAV